jgi:hypothetical protein
MFKFSIRKFTTGHIFMHRVRLSLRLQIHTAHWIFDNKLFPTVQRRKMSGRSYKDAINLLNTLQSNAAALEAAKRSNALGISQMVEYLERIGYKVRCQPIHKSRDYMCVSKKTSTLSTYSM